jgi:hypothetical protein
VFPFEFITGLLLLEAGDSKVVGVLGEESTCDLPHHL